MKSRRSILNLLCRVADVILQIDRLVSPTGDLTGIIVPAPVAVALVKPQTNLCVVLSPVRSIEKR